MIKPNYAFEKRQKEIAKKQKKQEKLQQKTVQHTEPAEPGTPSGDQKPVQK
ncbi:MAG TPA: hypothetical protein VNW52_03885 [Burkholderiaceae bacterium]|jgi:hypothetical protein|nr:hypothetical protein [Burkholderiaceae bacterium]